MLDLDPDRYGTARAEAWPIVAARLLHDTYGERLPVVLSDMLITHALVVVHRHNHPQSRAADLYRYTINTGCRKRRVRLDDARPYASWCSKWRRTKASEQIEADGRAEIIAEVRELLTGVPA